MNTVQVKLSGNRVVPAQVIRVNPKTLWVRLPDGNVVKRHKKKHLLNGQER
jgi:hypothetical protein